MVNTHLETRIERKSIIETPFRHVPYENRCRGQKCHYINEMFIKMIPIHIPSPVQSGISPHGHSHFDHIIFIL